MALSNYSQQFVHNVLKRYYLTGITKDITNQDYEGVLKEGGDRANILSFLGNVTLNDYTIGSDMSTQHLSDTEDQIIMSKERYYNFDIDRLDKHYTYVTDIESGLIKNATAQLKKEHDELVLGKYTEVKAGHRIGTDYDTGTITDVDADGTVTGNGTTWTSAMVGKGIEFENGDGDVKWYLISARNSNTEIEVTDWDDTDYSGTAFATKSKSYTIEANAKVQLTSSNAYTKILDLGEVLEQDEIPSEDRWLVVSPKIATIIKQDNNFTMAVPRAYEDVIRNGRIGKISGFTVFQSNQVSGNNTDGFYVLAGHKSFITFAQAVEDSRVMESQLQFSKLYQGLFVFGAKVATERRKAGAYLFCYV